MQPIKGIEKKLNLIDMGIMRINVNLKKSDISIIFLWSYLSIITPANRPSIKAGKYELVAIKPVCALDPVTSSKNHGRAILNMESPQYEIYWAKNRKIIFLFFKNTY